jgi:hypothetical protein
MSFTNSPQVIYQSEDGDFRLTAFLGGEGELVIDKQVYEVADEQSILPANWHSVADIPLDREESAAVRMAIDTYLETPLPPALQQMVKEAWAVFQAASRLAGYCRSIAVTPIKGAFGSPDYLPQSPQWVQGLLKEADRVAALIDGVVEPIEPVPPRGGNPVNWDGSHIAGPDIDLLVEFEDESLTNKPTWSVSDKWGEVIYLELAGLGWLAELLPRILKSYRSVFPAMGGGSNDS